MAFERILSPITINGLTIKNRVVRAAHGTSYGKGVISDDLIAYHEARARGGVGLNILEANRRPFRPVRTIPSTRSTIRSFPALPRWPRLAVSTACAHSCNCGTGGIDGRPQTAKRRSPHRTSPARSA